jgi:predicted TIM-barrel fold metal-dependent hydrolase
VHASTPLGGVRREVFGMSVFDEPKIDTHCHLLDPARFAYAPDVAYRPAGQEIAPLEQYLQVMQAYGIRHAVLVGPNSGYGTDNRCLLDALARAPGSLKGIAFVALDASEDLLAGFKAQGVVGVALNATVLGVDHVLRAGPLLARLRKLDLLLSLQVEHDQLAALRAPVEDSGVRVLVDHCGRPAAGAGVQQAGFQALLAMARNGRTAVKLSGHQKFSTQAPPFDDTRPYLEALIEAFGLDACLWASDWPFLRAPHRLDMGPLLRQVERLLPRPDDRRRLFWDSPRHWLGF